MIWIYIVVSKISNLVLTNRVPDRAYVDICAIERRMYVYV